MKILSIKTHNIAGKIILEAKIQKDSVTHKSDIVYVGYNLDNLTFYTYENSVVDDKPLNLLEKNPFSKEEWNKITFEIREKSDIKTKYLTNEAIDICDGIILMLQTYINLCQKLQNPFEVDYTPGLYKAIELIEELKRKDNYEQKKTQ